MAPARLTLLIAFLAFVSLGLPDAVTGVAWPSMRAEFSLSVGSLGWVLVAAGAGYAVSSVNVVRALERMRLGTLLAVSTFIVTLGVTGYALAPAWPLLLACAPLVGFGSGAIDAALNSYAAHRFSVRNVNWLHACYGIGATLGPAIMVATLSRELSWRTGYLVLASLLFMMASTFLITRRIWESPLPPGDRHGDAPATVTGLVALRHPGVRLQIAVFFCYTGLEVAIGQWAFTLQTELRGLSRELAGTGTVLYWSGLTAGRIALGSIASRVGPDRLLRLATFAALTGVVAFVAGPRIISLLGLALVGASLAPLYPTLMSRTPARVGASHSAQAIGFQVNAAMLGALAVPSLAGLLGNRFGLPFIAGMILATAVTLMALHEVLLSQDRSR